MPEFPRGTKLSSEQKRVYQVVDHVKTEEGQIITVLRYWLESKCCWRYKAEDRLSFRLRSGYYSIENDG